MRFCKLFSLLILSFIIQDAFAIKLLMAPKGQPPQCDQAYQNAAQPQTVNTVLASMMQVCFYAGGSNVTHSAVVAESLVTGIVLNCIGSTPNNNVFTCIFTYSSGDL